MSEPTGKPLNRKVQRYTLDYMSSDGTAMKMLKADDGEWCRFEDAVRAWPSEEALAQLRGALDEARAIVDVGEQRALVADSPVGHCREELSNAEFDRMWHAVERARAVLALLNGGTP